MVTQGVQAIVINVDIGVPIHIITEAENGGVRGAVVSAQVASGEVRNYAHVNSLVIAQTFQPQQEYRQHFDRMFELFLHLYTALRPHFVRIG